MWVEAYELIGNLAVLAYGAYNAFGLIGPEKGGVAVVIEEPEKAILGTKDFPYAPAARWKEFYKMLKLLEPSVLDWSPGGTDPLRIQFARLRPLLKSRDYEIRH
jgi:hypothetical protein